MSRTFRADQARPLAYGASESDFESENETARRWFPRAVTAGQCTRCSRSAGDGRINRI